MNDGRKPDVADVGVESVEDLNFIFPTPETNPLDAEVHQAAQEQHPEWFKDG